jgi:hypothetical protein
MATTCKEATELKGFAYNENGEIEATTYAEHVLRSASECTHHTGIMPCYSVEEITGDIYKTAAGEEITEDQYNDLSEEDQDECVYLGEGTIKWATVSRSSHQRGYSIDQEFETEDEASDYWFNQIEKYDFDRDDRRDTSFFYTIEEANNDRAQRIADEFNIDLEVAKSVFKKHSILKANNRV